MSDKKIRSNFDTNAFNYDAYADVQKTTADNLMQLIQSYDCESVLEIGCGTGCLSELLASKFRTAEFCFNDISPNMIKITGEKIKAVCNKAVFIECNIEHLNIEKHFDLIISNAVFQWIRDFDKLLKKLYNMLNSSGILAFTLFLDGTFYELDNAFKKTYNDENISYNKHILDFHSGNEIKKTAERNKFKLISYEEHDHTLYYSNPVEFLKSVKKIGAAGIHEKKVTYKIMRKMLANYNKLYMNKENKIPSTYRTLYCVLQKEYIL
jgi:malonyl-CoA O-methyltransferase